MTRPSPTQLLPPPRPLFVGCSLWIAFLLSMLSSGDTLIGLNILPVVLVFWNIHYPRQVGMGIAFLFGILMDIQSGFLLGSNALTYTILSFAAIVLRRRFLWFGHREQILQLFILFSAQELLFSLIQLLIGNISIGWDILITPLLQSLLWPIMSFILQWPQRRMSKSESNRHR